MAMIAIKNNKRDKNICVILVILFCFGSLFISNNFIFASETSHIVISEIQISGATVYDEFIELYNPTGAEIDLANWDLKRKTKTGNESNILNNIEGAIPAYGYFLIVPRPNCGESGLNACYDGATSGDDEYTTDSFLAKDNTILLYDGSGNLVDIVGWGETGDFEEEAINTNLENNQSLERKTADGVILDTDNNKNDFILQINPNPQNSGSPKEPPENELSENKLPIVEILSPENDSVYTEEEVINFKAEVSDLEDGAVSNENVVWKEEDTELGKGNEIEAKNLAVGSHTITLEVQDNDGGKTAKEITIRIIFAQNVEDSGEEDEVSNDQNNFNQESNQKNGTSGNQNESNQENSAASVGGGQSSSSSGSGAASISLPKIVIMEFLPNPEDSDRDSEFIEIYNNDNTEIDLSKWTLEDKIGQIKKFTIAEGVKIKPKKYKVFYSDETGIALNNSGDGIVLKDNKNNIISETAICGAASEEQAYTLDENSKWAWTLRPTPGRKNIIEAPPEDISVSAKKDNGGNKNEEKKDADGDSGKQEDSGQEKEADEASDESYDFSDSIIISEIYPNPKGKDNTDGSYEWIELYNNSDGDVNISGWQIDDVLKRGSKPYVINWDRIIKARSYEKLDNSETKLVFNNSGDEINIIWPDGTVVDNVSYEESIDGESYNLSNNESWFWSLEATPGAENKTENKVLGLEAKSVSQDTQSELDNESLAGYFENSDDDENYLGGGVDYIETNIEDLKHFTKYTRVKISGIVSTRPGIFSDKSFYIYGSGIQIYSYRAQIPQLEIGDYVEIIGRISEIGGEKRILLDKEEDIKIIYHLTEPKSEIISTGNVGEEAEGRLATIEGKITKILKDVFFVDDGSGKAKIYIKPQTGIKMPDIKMGDWAVVTGQVSQTSAGYRILPRFSRDIKISETKETSTISENYFSTSSAEKNWQWNKNSVLYFVFIVIGLAILVDWGMMRIRK